MQPHIFKIKGTRGGGGKSRIPEVMAVILNYSLHRKKVYTWGKAKYSKPRGARGEVGGATHPPFSWSKLDQASF